MVAHALHVRRHCQPRRVCRALRHQPLAPRGPVLIARPPQENPTTRTLPMAAAMTFAEAIDAIEETYEFMLAYAAQGRRGEDEDQGTGIRERLTRVETALGVIASA